MDAQEFESKTGRKPQDDDLDRVNCTKAGNMLHRHCGWCDKCSQPKFTCKCGKD